MKTTAIALLGSCLLLSAPAFGQSLSDRINYVMQQRAQAQLRGTTTKAHLLSVLMYTPVTVQVQETPVRELINHLAQNVLNINIIGRYSDDKVGHGIDPETPITLDAIDKPALNVLELILDQCQDLEETTWQLRNGFVEIGTKARLSARGARQIKYYPIRDLLFEPPMFDNAPELDLSTALNQGQRSGGGGGSGGGSIFGDPGDDPDRLSEEERALQLRDLITETIEPEAWGVNGGDWATIRYYQGTFIIMAPDYIHRQIGGYPFAIRPVGRSRAAASAPRYLSFTGVLSNSTVTNIREVQTTGRTGGR